MTQPRGARTVHLQGLCEDGRGPGCAPTLVPHLTQVLLLITQATTARTVRQPGPSGGRLIESLILPVTLKEKLTHGILTRHLAGSVAKGSDPVPENGAVRAHVGVRSFWTRKATEPKGLTSLGQPRQVRSGLRISLTPFEMGEGGRPSTLVTLLLRLTQEATVPSFPAELWTCPPEAACPLQSRSAPAPHHERTGVLVLPSPLLVHWSHTGTPKPLRETEAKKLGVGGGWGRVTLVANYKTVNLANTMPLAELGCEGIYTL